MHETWLAYALDPPRAYGLPAVEGRLRAEAEDFVVEEDLGFPPDGAGAHLLVRVRKRDANTEWVARELARIVGCRVADIGFAGLKDRHAVAIQWFSVPNAEGRSNALRDVRGAQFEVLETHAHRRKLPRGALAGNRFLIRIRDARIGDRAGLAARLALIGAQGVPNYFGPQRFGRGANNLRGIRRDVAEVSAADRRFVLSAARSLIFNAVLAVRVANDSWRRLEAGDVANLDARGSIFAVEEIEEDLRVRCEGLELHPTGPLWGAGPSLSRGHVQLLEERVAGELDEPQALVISAGMRQERRSLRIAVRDLRWELARTDLTLTFRLSKGSFATAVLRELLASDSGSDAVTAEE